MANRRKKKKITGKKKVIIFAVEILLLAIMLTVLALYNMTFGKIQFDSLEDAGINEDLSDAALESMDGYINIALFGLDNRTTGNYKTGNSDSIMVASINEETKEVRIASIYRDTYLNIGDEKYRKVNAAYSNGGVENAVKTLNSNLDLTITEYVCVDWKALIEAIDALGGIDLEVTTDEASIMAPYIDEIQQSTGFASAYVAGGGMTHLDGVQAVAYTRVRYTAGDDFLRASRQRLVIQAMLAKAKEADVKTLTNMCKDIFDDISTSLSITQILSLASDVNKYEIASTTGFPFKLSTASLPKTGSTVVAADLETNVVQLHEYLYGDEEYEISATVKSISEEIVNATGVTKDSDCIDTSNYNETVGADGTEGTKAQNKEMKNSEKETETEQ